MKDFFCFEMLLHLIIKNQRSELKVESLSTRNADLSTIPSNFTNYKNFNW
jgi:hypothetical protein